MLKFASMKFEFKKFHSVFTNVRFRSWSSKPLSVNAALVDKDGGLVIERLQNLDSTPVAVARRFVLGKDT